MFSKAKGVNKHFLARNMGWAIVKLEKLLLERKGLSLSGSTCCDRYERKGSGKYSLT
jgi:hypothetical protein